MQTGQLQNIRHLPLVPALLHVTYFWSWPGACLMNLLHIAPGIFPWQHIMNKYINMVKAPDAVLWKPCKIGLCCQNGLDSWPQFLTIRCQTLRQLAQKWNPEFSVQRCKTELLIYLIFGNQKWSNAQFRRPVHSRDVRDPRKRGFQVSVTVNNSWGLKILSMWDIFTTHIPHYKINQRVYWIGNHLKLPWEQITNKASRHSVN